MKMGVLPLKVSTEFGQRATSAGTEAKDEGPEEHDGANLCLVFLRLNPCKIYLLAPITDALLRPTPGILRLNHLTEQQWLQFME